MFAVVVVIFIAINLDVQQETLCGDTSHQQPAAATTTKQQQETGQSQIQLNHLSKMNRYPDEYKAVREHLRSPGSNNMTSKYKLITFNSSTGKKNSNYYPLVPPPAKRQSPLPRCTTQTTTVAITPSCLGWTFTGKALTKQRHRGHRVSQRLQTRMDK